MISCALGAITSSLNSAISADQKSHVHLVLSFRLKTMENKEGFFQFDIIINVLFSSFLFIYGFTAIINIFTHLPLASLTWVLPQKPGCIEYYNQLLSLCGHLGGVSEIQTSLDVSDLKIGHKRSRRIDILFICHAQLPVLYRQVGNLSWTVRKLYRDSSWRPVII